MRPQLPRCMTAVAPARFGDPNTGRSSGTNPMRHATASGISRIVSCLRSGAALGVSTSQLWQLAESGAYEGRQIDWGA
jgi:hypothetical protein